MNENFLTGSAKHGNALINAGEGNFLSGRILRYKRIEKGCRIEARTQTRDSCFLFMRADS